MDILIKKLEKKLLLERVDEFIGILSGEPHEYWTYDHFTKELPLKFDLSIVAFAESRIAGYIIASLKETGPYIHKFMVHPEYRNLSIGGKMLGFFEKTIRENGFGTIDLNVIEENKSAIKFYAKHGFSISGKKKAGDGDYSLAIMTKSVTKD